ncbi:IS3 family transposase [Candidatus Glomeribacter gigasporarum]|uniref:IS3 family transposase n=1 Tax=Candidatus Glomeribacter gigasporarum TaxID=132144 RepID=UPI000C7B10A4
MGKYTEQTKLTATEDYCGGHSSLKTVARRHSVDISSLRKWVAVYKMHGATALKTKEKKCHSVEFKLSVLKRVRDEGLSLRQAAALFDIPRFDMIGHWERQYREGGLDALSWGSHSCHNRMKKNQSPEATFQSSKNDARSREELLEELNFFRMENADLKKPRGLGSNEEAGSARERAQVVFELRQQYPLAGLLKVASLARSTFYYPQKALQMPDESAGLKRRMGGIFEVHKGQYGNRRVTAVIRQESKLINHKTVQRLMGTLQLKSRVREKKYRAYRGEVGRAAPNILERQFQAHNPNQKWVTDVTEFNVGGKKLYLSPVMNLYNGEIVSYEIAKGPLFDRVASMLGKAFNRLKPRECPILHSDPGWQYRLPLYGNLLKQHTVTPSMSRKGNGLDNAAMESFFATLKSEFYPPNEFRDINELREGLHDYIRYYHYDRIKMKLNGWSPVVYRARFA